MSKNKQIQFFLGSNTKKGFVPLFEQLRDPANGTRMYILKGGPGSGKSSLMRKIAKTLEEHNHTIEYIPCASDPHSLDAIIDYDAKITMVDGTAPHTMDPKYPGAYDTIINLGEAWNDKFLMESKDRIIELSDIISQCHTNATACITSAASLLDNNRTLAKPYINKHNVKETIQELISELAECSKGKERKRLISAISVGKTVYFHDTIKTLCNKIYALSDEYGAASNEILSQVRDYAIDKNLDFITCYCSIQNPDKIDHLLFPSLKLGIVTVNSFLSNKYKDSVLLEDLTKPMDPWYSEVMDSNLLNAKQLIKRAANHVNYSKLLHDELEAYYIHAMDFSKVDEIYVKIINEILGEED